MACNCSASCNCDSGVELIGVVDGVSAPTTTNVVVNANNTITYTFSDGSTITTSAITVNDPSALSYVTYHSSTVDTYTVPANSLATIGDKLKVTYKCSVPSAESLNLKFDSNVICSYVNSVGETTDMRLEIEIIRNASNKLEFLGEIVVFNPNSIVFGATNVIQTISTVVVDSFEQTPDVYDFATDLIIEGGNTNVTLDLLNIELIKND